MTINAVSSKQQSEQEPCIGIWQAAKNLTSRGIYNLGHFVAREGLLLAGSAACGYIGTKLFAELPANMIAKGLDYCFNDVSTFEWTYLNAPGIAALAAATVPVFQITNKIFKPVIHNDGTQKAEAFNLNDAARMAQAGFLTYAGIKLQMEVPYNLIVKVASAFKETNPNASWPEALMGISGAAVLVSGISDYDPEKSVKNNKFAISEMAVGTGLFGGAAAYLGVGTVSKLYTDFMDATSLSIQSLAINLGLGAGSFGLIMKGMNDLKAEKKKQAAAELVIGGTGAAYSTYQLGSTLFDAAKSLYKNGVWYPMGVQAIASRSAVGLPIQILTRQVFGKMLFNPDIPEVVRKGTEIIATSINLVAATTIAHHLGLPGATYTDPYEAFKNMVIFMGGFYAVQKIVPLVIDYLLPEDEPVVDEDDPTAKLIHDHIHNPKKENSLANKIVEVISSSKKKTKSASIARAA